MENLPSPHPRYSASPAEIETGKRVVAELGLKIESLEREIKELTNRLLPLQRQRTNHLSYISPLRCLPDEVLVEILITCVQEGVKVTNLSQICGRLRDLIIGTPILWSYIHLVPKYQGPISEHRVYNTCHPTNSRELKWALTCAKAAPLRLYLEVPVESASLNPIIRRNSPIYSLTVVVRGDFTTIETGIFSGLDMSPLKELHLIRMDDAGIGHLMDTALHSGTENLALSLNFSRARILQHLQHKLIHRVTHLHIITDGASVDTASKELEPTDTRSSRVIFWKIEGPFKILDILDFSGAKVLEFHCDGLDPPMPPMSIPSQLTTLTLKRVGLSLNGLLRNHLHLLPNLISLTVTDSRVEDRVFFFRQDNHRHEAADGIYDVSTRAFSRKYSFRLTPQLELISLCQIMIDENLADHLQDCPSLLGLLIHDCDVESFFLTFIDHMQNAGYLPSLRTLQLDRSWPRYLDATYTDLEKYCASERPMLSIFSSERKFQDEGISDASNYNVSENSKM